MKWTKPNGNEIETNDEKATIDYCESLGFKPKKAKQKSKNTDEAAD